MSTTPPPRRPPVFGPEPWEESGGRSWSHWDLWFCAVAVADHDGRLDQLEERLESLDKAGLAVGERLALYRAFHTAGLEHADRTDDSFGHVGEMRREAWHTYLGIDWQAAGMAPGAYWADLCDLVVFEDYALEFEEETLPWSHVPAGQAELVEGVLLALEAECRAVHLDYPADQALEQLAWLAVAGRRFTRYVEMAARLGTDHWRELEALATSALRSRRRDLAVEVFQAADRPGGHQQRLRERCTSLTGVVIGDAGGSRPSLEVVRGSTSGSARR